MSDSGNQPGADDEGTGRLPVRVESLLRLLPDHFRAGDSGSMAAAQAEVRDLEAVEAGNSAVQEAMRSWSQEGSGGALRRKLSWTLAYSQQSRNEHRVPGCVLRRARTSADVDRDFA